MAQARTVNLKFLGIALGTLAAGAVGVHFLHAFQVGRNSGILKQQALQAAEQDRSIEAENYFRLYMGYHPEDNEARIALAQTIEKRPDRSARDLYKVFLLYEEAVRRQPENADVRRHMIQMMLKGESGLGLVRAVAEAKKHITYLKRTAKDDGELELMEAKTIVLSRGKDDDARALCQKAITHKPDLLEAYTLLAELLYRGNQQQEADKWIDRMVETNKTSSEAYLRRARYYETVHPQAAEAQKAVTEAFRLEPDKVENIQAMVRLALKQNKVEEARQYLVSGLEKHPSNAAMYLMLAAVEEQVRRPQEAEDVLRRGLRGLSGDKANLMRYQLAHILLRQSKVADAERVIDELRKSNAPQPLVDELRAHVLIHERQWAQAATLLESVRPALPRELSTPGQTEVLLGFCYENLGEIDRAYAAYRDAVSRNGNLPQARLGLASTLATVGKLDDAIAEYRLLYRTDPSVAPRLIRLLVQRNLRDDQKPNWTEVDQVLNGMISRAPKAAETILLQAEVQQAQGKMAEARATLTQARDAQPDKVEFWLALATLNSLEGKLDAGIDVLDQAEKKLGDRLEFRLARARFLIRSDRPGSAEALAKLEQDSGKLGANEPRLWQGLAELYSRAGKAEDAQRLWDRVAQAQPKDLRVRLAQFDLALAKGDLDAMAKLADEIRTLEGDQGSLWRYARACRTLTEVRAETNAKKRKDLLEQLRKDLALVLRQRPNWTPAMIRGAEADEIQGDIDAALQKYTQALDNGENSPTVIRRVVQIHYQQRHYDEARRLLTRLRDLSGGMDRIKTSLDVMSNDFDNAIAEARKPLQNGSKDPKDYVWLGQILLQARAARPAEAAKLGGEAEKVLRQAIQLPGADRVPEAWIALVQCLALTNQKDQAAAIIQQAQQKLPVEIQANTLAQCYEMVDNLKQAGAKFKEALDAQPESVSAMRSMASFYLRHGQPAAADPYLRMVLDSARASTGDVAWARRGVATILSTSGDYADYVKAVALLDDSLRQNPNSIEDMRAKAMILARRAERRQDALRILDELQRRQFATSDELLTLARLYEQVRDWPRARAIYINLAAREDRAQFVAPCVNALLRNKEFSEVPTWLTKLKRLEPNSLRTLSAEARFLKSERKDAEALALIKQMQQQAKPNEWLELAQLCEELTEYDQAIDLYRRFAAQASRPEPILNVALCLARKGDIDGGLAICDAAWKNCAPESVAEATVQVLATTKRRSDQQYQNVGSQMQEALNKNPKSLVLTLHLAAIRSIQSRYNEAVELYRKVLEMDPNNVLAMNNLAWLLAASGDESKATEALGLMNRAIKLGGPLAELLDTRALVNLRLNRSRDALRDLNEAMSNDLPTGTMYFHLALAQKMADRRKEALEALNKARKDYGLARSDLHPLEQDSYDRLNRELE